MEKAKADAQAAALAAEAAKTAAEAMKSAAAITGNAAKSSAAATALSTASTIAEKANQALDAVKADSTIKIEDQSTTYTGKALAYTGKVTKTGSTGSVSFAYYSDAACATEIAASEVKDVKTYYVKATVAADDDYKAATSDAAKFTVNPANNTFVVKAAKAKLSAKAKKATTISAKKAFKVVENASNGKVTYAKKSGNKKIKVAANGKIKVKKGLKKGKLYKVKVLATSAKTQNYNAASTMVTIKVKVK